jgi:hypothetical protein
MKSDDKSDDKEIVRGFGDDRGGPPPRESLVRKNDGKTVHPVRSRTDQRYWIEHVGRRVRKVDGVTVTDPNFSVQIAFGGKRERVKLATSNKTEAAARAAAFFRSLIAGGWPGAYAAHEFAKAGERGKPADENAAAKDGPGHSLGALFLAYDKVASPRASTLATYKKALRKIYSEIGGISGAGRFKSASTGNRVWKEKVDGLPLSAVTIEKLMEWKQQQLGRSNCTLDERRAHAITLNSLLRNARAVFAKKHRALLAKHVELPAQIAFDEVRLESSQTPRYRSRIDARAILKAADEELKVERPILYTALNLALRAGLRRREIDTLLWKSVDLERKVIHVEANEFYDLKSTDSAGGVDIGDELAGFLAAFRKQHHADMFVLPTLPLKGVRKAKALPDGKMNDGAHEIQVGNYTKRMTPSDSYRCARTFDDLTAWLRLHGVMANRPIHELRKEIGSLVADEHGIYAASRFMRHADIRITAASYLDKKKRIVAPI